MPRDPNTTIAGAPFDKATIEAVWAKAKPISGYTMLSRDTCGAVIARNDYGKISHQGWEIDHIVPVAKGGSDDLSNLQPLHWENNRGKGDDSPDWQCKRDMETGTTAHFRRGQHLASA